MVLNRLLGKIDIKTGIFQVDSLSPTWFCLALNSLATPLNSSSIELKINKQPLTKANYLLFRDDLKLKSSQKTNYIYLSLLPRPLAMTSILALSLPNTRTKPYEA